MLTATQKAAAAPQVVRVDGSIFDNSGNPFTGGRDVQIKAYTAASGGTLLWTSSVYNASVVNGRFTLNLDATTGSPSLVSALSDLSSASGVYFEIVYDTGAADGSMDTPVSVKPRIRSRGSMYALVAAKADSLNGLTASLSQLNMLSGATSSVQTQIDALNSGLNGKQNTLGFSPLNKAGDSMNGNLILGQQKELRLGDTGTHFVGFKASDSVAANIAWVLPAADGSANQVLKTDGSGNLSWMTNTGGTVTAVTASGSISATGTSAITITISTAGASGNGVLTATDWATFNGKQDALGYTPVNRAGDSMSGALNVGASVAAQSLNLNLPGGQYKIAGNTVLSIGTGTGSMNLMVGVDAGTSTTSGVQNTFVGYQAGTSNTTGTASSAFGYQALSAGGTGNSAFGYQTLVQGGSQNSAFGTAALYYGGSGNSAFGYNANNHSGSYNSTFGTWANYTGNSSYNSIFGYYAGYLNTGGNNSLFGYQAGQFNTSGTNNVMLGYNVGQSVTTASQNTLLGASSDASTSATSSTALGYLAIVTASSAVQLGTGTNATADSLQFRNYNFLDKNGNATFNNITINGSFGGTAPSDTTKVAKTGDSMSGALNVGANVNATAINLNLDGASYQLGGSALLSAGTGTGAFNTLVGVSSGTSLTSGTSNTFVGYKAGTNTTTASGNTLIGNAAGRDNTGTYNTMMGFNAGVLGTSGSRNTILGYQAGFNVAHDNNTFVGSSAGYTNTGSTQNVYLGTDTGYSNNNSYNTFIGYRAAFHATNAPSNVVIGHNAGSALSNQSLNTLVGVSSDVSTTTLNGTALGTMAIVTASSSVQLGRGTNSTADSLQFRDYNFLDKTGNAHFNNLTVDGTVTGNFSDATKVAKTGDSMSGALNVGANVSAQNIDLNSASGSFKIAGNTMLSVGTGVGAGNTFGGLSGSNIGAGTSNSLFGYQAGHNTSGTNNTSMGYQAGYNTTGGQGNSAFGYQSGYNMGNSNYGSFFGNMAGYQTTGGNGSFFGSGAGRYASSGTYNSMFGHGAGYELATGGYNTFLGASAGYKGNTGSFNTYVGYQAAAGAYQTGSQNSAFGYFAANSLTSGQDNTAIGTWAGVSISTGARNTLVGVSSDVGETASNSVALGYLAMVNASSAVQLGRGTNSTADSLQFRDYNFLDKTGNAHFNNVTFDGTITGAGLGGNYVSKNGDTMTGSLTLLGGSTPGLNFGVANSGISDGGNTGTLSLDTGGVVRLQVASSGTIYFNSNSEFAGSGYLKVTSSTASAPSIRFGNSNSGLVDGGGGNQGHVDIVTAGQTRFEVSSQGTIYLNGPTEMAGGNQFKITSTSAAAPSIKFGSSNNGFSEGGSGTGNVDVVTGGATRIEIASSGTIYLNSLVNLPLTSGSKVLATDGSKNLVESSIDTTHLGFLSAVTGDIQGQLDGKATTANALLKSGGTMTGAIALTAGSANTPAMNLGDSDTGLYKSSTGEVAITAAGAQRVKVSTAGIAVTGQATASQYVISSGATIDFNNGNIQVLQTATGSAITLNNMQDGGSYTVVITDTTARTYSFTNCTNTKWAPAQAATSGQTVFTLLKLTISAQTYCYVSWITGF